VRLLADLHNHSCLSPCASLEQSPSLLAKLGKERGLSLMALSDHNASLNCPAFAGACSRQGILPLFGVEACSIEEVHTLILFGRLSDALDFGLFLKDRLPPLPYDPKKLGDEVVVDADEYVLDLPDYFMGSALNLSFEEICAQGRERGALVIPAHVDRPMFSVSSQLGFLPAGPYDAVESMRPPVPELCCGLPVISGSDAHYPEHVARRPFALELPDPVVAARLSSADPDCIAGQALLEAVRAALPAAVPCWGLAQGAGSAGLRRP